MYRALIADDEPVLAQALQRELIALWPELEVLATVGDGQAAVQAALAQRPELVFLDIRMPGLDGLEAALAITEQWPADQALPALVFVTAHEAHALQAFDAAALDYVLKPVRPERLTRTVQRLQAHLAAPTIRDQAMLAGMRALLQARPAAPLTVLQASVGQQLHMVPVQDVLLLEAADKHVRVLTQDGRQWWLRTPLRELVQRLDPEVFWQIHRSTVVRAQALTQASRDAQGQWVVQLREPGGRHRVSRLFAHRFSAM